MIALLSWLLFAAPKTTPPPTARYADVTVRYARGEVSIVAVKPARFDKPTSLPRFRGRFEARALKAKSVVDQVAFDFPLVADAETDDTDESGRKLAERFRRGATVETSVRVPLPEGADAIEIYDTQTKKSVSASLAAKEPDAPAGAPRAK